MQDPAARIFFWILCQRGLQFFRKQVNHVLPAFWRAFVAQIYEQARFVRGFEKSGVRCCKRLSVIVALKLLQVNVVKPEFFKIIERKT
jgi:hypothetical protein